MPAMVFMFGRDEPFPVVEDPETVQRFVENAQEEDEAEFIELNSFQRVVAIERDADTGVVRATGDPEDEYRPFRIRHRAILGARNPHTGEIPGV